MIVVFISTVLIDKPVDFADEGFENAVRIKLRHYNKPIFRSQLHDIYELDLSGLEITDLEDVRYFHNLEILNLSKNNISDVSSLTKINNLKVIDLGYNRIVDLKAANFHKITNLDLISLNLDHNLIIDETGEKIRLSDISLLENFPKLEELSLEDNYIKDFSVLFDLAFLTSLNISENNIDNIYFLEKLPQLKELNLRDNNIKDLLPLKYLGRLEYLNLHSNSNIETISPIKNLTNLETLILRNVPLADEIHFLSEMTNLIRLNLRNCSISDFSTLIHLMEKGALQNIPELNKVAYLDILENDFPNDPEELKGFVPYWDNIKIKYPIKLNYSTLASPSFSHESGYYSDPILLSISSSNETDKIFYTLDGSIPNMTSNIYKEPVLIRPDELLGEFRKGIVVRARYYNESLTEISPISTSTFFFFDHKAHSLPTISIAINPEYLFDNEIGIYISGNYLERGLKWERPSFMEFFEDDGTLAFKRGINLRIHGQESRRLAQKSFRIYTNPLYNASKNFSHQLFSNYYSSISGDPIVSFETFLLRNSGTDIHRTMFRDGFVQSLYDEIPVERQAFRPAILFVNGEYWGIYNIRERIDHHYFNNHFGVDVDDVALLEYKANVGLVGDAEDKSDYLKLHKYISEKDTTDQEVFEYVEQVMDIDNFINYQILQIFSGNLDWPQNNNVFWRLKTSEHIQNDSMVYDGRWRWVLNDMDFAFNASSLNLMEHATGDHESALLLRVLLKNEDFRNKFLVRFSNYLNTVFLTDHMLEKMSTLRIKIEPEIVHHIERWSLPSSYDEWLWNINNMEEFARKRPEIMTKHLLKYFNLSGIYEITLETNIHRGYISINSLPINLNTPGINNYKTWKGNYFNDVPIRLKAHSYIGYRFSHWEISELENILSEEVILQPDNSITIKAVFDID